MLSKSSLIAALVVIPLPLFAACSSSNEVAPKADAGGNEAGGGDAGADAASGPSSNIRHVVIVIQENKSFDSYFGTYCTAATGSNPTCNTGPACCEAAPARDPGAPDGGGAPVVLDDVENAGHDPRHDQACELKEINGGAMDKFATAVCGSTRNIAYVNPALIAPYRNYAQTYAMADRYFQPVVGQSSSNDMYFARAKYVFLDNTETPKGVSAMCNNGANPSEHTDTTLSDLLVGAGVPWGFYIEGYKAAVDAKTGCPAPAADCAIGLMNYPCIYDPGDIPFAYYPSSRDNPLLMHDLGQLATDVTGGTLPAVSFVKALGYKTEHPGVGVTVSAGVTFVSGVVSSIQASKYADDTLILVTYDESGGYFDHVAPPPPSTVDMQPYGARVPFMAIGKFARKNFISHVVMEHSSIVKFIEWNFLGKKTGQLGTRDAVVNNLGSLLDPAATGTPVPEQ